MRYAAPLLLLALCLLTLLFPSLALASAREALGLFFENVLPALFPFYVLTSMLCRTALFSDLEQRPQRAGLLCYMLGGLAGYPVGARLSAALGRESLSAGCNQCSPMFLLGVVSLAMYRDAAMFPVLAIAHYGAAGLVLLLNSVLGAAEPSQPCIRQTRNTGGTAFFADIGDGMLAMLRIGGCVLFFYVMARLLCRVLPVEESPLPVALVSGVLEMTSGCAQVRALGFPPRICAGMYAFFVSFGGLSVFAQSVITAGLQRPGRYLFYKLIQGFAAALLAYFLAPLFLGQSVPAASLTAEDYWNNALLSFAFVSVSLLGLCGSYLFAHLTEGLKKRTRARVPGSGDS